jgi:hypothetical protein
MNSRSLYFDLPATLTATDSLPCEMTSKVVSECANSTGLRKAAISGAVPIFSIRFAGQRCHSGQTVSACAIENAHAVAEPDLVEVHLLGVSGVFPELVEARRSIVVSEHAAGVE